MSKWTSIIFSLVSAIIGGLIVGAIGFLIALKTDLFLVPKPDENREGAGYKMLMGFQCPYGEAKHVLMRGLDDNFALGNAEPSRRLESLETFPGHVANKAARRDYDDTGQDKIFTDFFEVPENVSRGLFVIGLEAPNGSGNDKISIGHVNDFKGLAKSGHDYNIITQNRAEISLARLAQEPGWEGMPSHIYSARLKDMRFFNFPEKTEARQGQRHTHLLPYLQSLKSTALLDVIVEDDTAVDFMGLAVCTPPTEHKGLTFVEFKPLTHISHDLQLWSCDTDLMESPCNPMFGDTSCKMALPLACFSDTGAPVPDMSSDIAVELQLHVENYWAGGDIAFTPKVRGDSFKTLADTNEYCRALFGRDWRVLNFHDGGSKGVATRRVKPSVKGRVWVDIKDQPLGTCWSRDDTLDIELRAEK